MTSATELNASLFSCHENGPYSAEMWQEIFNHVLEKLVTFLGQPVLISDVRFNPDGFVGDILSKDSFGGLLAFSWFGRIGVTVVGRREATDLSAWIFFRGFGKRLVAADDKDFLYLSYVERETGDFEWTATWDKDIYGEFEHWK